MTQTPKPKLSDMSGYGADDVVILERKTYEELLAALKAFVESADRHNGERDADCGWDFDGSLTDARAAIAKAEGR